MAARLGHLCRLIARDRRPYCPINGVLALIPYAALADDHAADQAGGACRRDLDVARDALKVRCPAVALVRDLEDAPGFVAFVAGFPEPERRRFLGVVFPLVPALDASALPAMVADGLGWTARTLLPALVDRLWRVADGAADGDVAEATRANGRLYRLLGRWRGRHARLARLLVRAFVFDVNGPPPFGGCYLAGTGRDAARQQAFVAGAFRRLIEAQDAESWTPEALADDAEYRLRARVGLGAIAASLAAPGALAWRYWPS